MDKLKEYNKKRNIAKSNEPAGIVQKDRKSELIFSVQHHIASHDHFDLRLQWRGVLLSFAIPKGPSLNPEDKRLAIKVEDHPLDYADFEDIIPKGNYGEGTVMLWDSGTWNPYKNVDKSLKTGELKFELYGKRLKGQWALIKLKTKEDNEWLLIKEKDSFAKNDDGIMQFDTSIKTNRTMDEITNNEKPKMKSNVFKLSKLMKNMITKVGKDIYVGKVKISNPNKLLFDKPKIKKIDIVLYYAYMSKFIMPYIEGRVLSVIRCPNGVNGEKFYKKHPTESSSENVKVVQIESVDKLYDKTKKAKSKDEEQEKNTDYFYIDKIDGLIFETQMNTIEFHPWGSKYKTLAKPDIMVFDLDPNKGLSIKKLRQGVRDLKSILDTLHIVSFLKTSGGKGYHIVVPFQPSVDWKTFRDFSKRIAETMEKIWPDRYTSNMRMEKRKGRIFIDWERNIRGATSVAPYSIRIRPNAPVSMPILWEELDTIKPNQITMKKALKKVSEGNPWKDFFEVSQKLKIIK